MADGFLREVLTPPEGTDHVLLHSCCAPCSGEVMEAITASGVGLTVLFYNPNIHPRREYELRKDENKRFCDRLGIPFVDGDYETDDWFARVKGLEHEPERGRRCTVCFEMRFERTALFAHEHGHRVITSSLGISRWKDWDQVTGAGERAASRYEDVTYWTWNWRKRGGAKRMYEIAKRERFYQQEYCGCVYSLRDTNRWRVSRGREKIRIGESFYSPDGACSLGDAERDARRVREG